VPGNLGWSGDDHCDWRGLSTCRRSKVNQSLVLADQAVLADPTARLGTAKLRWPNKVICVYNRYEHLRAGRIWFSH
jgi:hypothetical protein